MPNQDYAAISGALNTRFEGVSKQINRAVVLLGLLGSKPAEAGSKNISWDVRFGTATPATAPINDGADVSTYNLDNTVPATLNYGRYHDAFALSGFAMAAAANAGPEALADLFIDSIRDSVPRLTRAIGSDVYLGTGATNRLHGLVDATIPAIGDTGIYAGVDPATYTQWKGTVIDAAGAALSKPMMRGMRRRIYVANGMKPDLIVCSPIQHEAYGETFGGERRYVQEVRFANGGVVKLDAGYSALEFDGIPVIEDSQCPDDMMLFLNTNEVVPRQLPAVDNQGTGGRERLILGGTPEEQFGPGRVNMQAHIIRLAITGDLYKFALYVYPGLQVKTRNACGYIKGLRTT